MENIFVAIVTGDKEYGRSLSLGILSICRGFIIRIFTGGEFLEEDRDYDIVLWDGEEVSRVFGGRIVYLAEKPSDAVKNHGEKRFAIYKYSTASSTVASIFEIYEALTGRQAVNLRRQDVRLFAFSSCVGGAGCTTLAMSVAQELCRFQGKHVLYLSFEEMDSVGEYMGNDGGLQGVSVYLYELFNKIYTGRNNPGWPAGNSAEPPSGNPFLDRYMIRDDFGMEAFAPSAGRNPLRELNVGELNRFIASLIDSGRFDVIIMDIGQWLSRTGLKCMEMAEKICFVSGSNCKDARRNQYISHIVSNCGEEIPSKTVTVINRADQQPGESRSEGKSGESFLKVSSCRTFANEGGYRKIFLEGEFGKDISILTEKMTEPECS